MAGEIKTLGVIGAGQMGSGIAHVAAVAGIDVVLNDLSEDRLRAGLATINGTMTRQVKKGQMSEAARAEALTRITTAQDFAALGDCDLVIEAATENEVVKRKIFSTLCASLKPATLLASNTSSISITRLASVTDRPERFHRHPLHEPGSSDAARGADPRHPDLARYVRDRQGLHRPSRQGRRPCPRISRPSSSIASCCP